MQSISRQAEVRPETRPYEPRGASLDLMKSRAGEVLIEGPAGTGKSRAILEKLHALCTRFPGIRCLIVRKTRESLSQSILVTFEEKVVEAGSAIIRGPQRSHRQSYRYANGSEIVLGGMDKSSRIMSSEYDVIAAFEATELTEDDWESLLTRLRNHKMPYQQAIADCNPGAPSHWLNKRAESSRMARLLSRHADNPSVTGEYLERLSQLTGVRRERLFLGRWVAAEGVVYSDWDAAIHLIDHFVPPDDWRRVRSIDFGFTNPFVCLWIAIDPDDRAYIYRQIYRTATLVEDHAEEINRLSTGERIGATVADHDAEDRATLHRRDIPTLAARKDVTTGIQAVADRLRVQADGKPRLFVMRDSLVSIDSGLRDAGKPIDLAGEFDCYIWDQSRRGPKETPVKQHDHGLDALRYAVVHLDNPAVRVSFVNSERAAGPEAIDSLSDEWREYLGGATGQGRI